MGGQPSHSHSGGHGDRNRHGNRGSANRACDTSGRRRINNGNDIHNTNEDANNNDNNVIEINNNDNNGGDNAKAAGPAAWLAKLGLAGWLRGLPA